MKRSALILLSFVFSLSVTPDAGAAVGPLAGCLRQAEHGTDPASRDNRRTQCLRSFAARLDHSRCLRLAHGFEYSTNSEAMKTFCTLDLKRDPKPMDCARAARSMDYGASRDDLVWGCLRRLNLSLSKKECHRLVQLMVFPFQKDRASSYCENEIRAARR